jgi:hypothetical protein
VEALSFQLALPDPAVNRAIAMRTRGLCVTVIAARLVETQLRLLDASRSIGVLDDVSVHFGYGTFSGNIDQLSARLELYDYRLDIATPERHARNVPN